MGEHKQAGTIRLVCRNIFERDAVGNFCFDIEKLLQQNNIPVKMYAFCCDDFNREHINLEENIISDSTDEDVILYFHSIYDLHLDLVLQAKAKKKIVYFHGITDPVFFRETNPNLSIECQKGFDQLALLSVFDQFAANSRKSALILVEHMKNISIDQVVVIPPVTLRDGASRLLRANESRVLLYVGRLKTHKKIEDVIKVFSEYLKKDPSAELWLVGGDGDPAYMDELKQMDIVDKIKWHGLVTDEELKACYAKASAYISMSEDEGFCVPLIEAMQAGLPVFAYGIPAVKEVLNGAGKIYAHKNYSEIASDIHEILNNELLKNKIIAQQDKQVEFLLSRMDGQPILQLLAS